MLGLKALGFFLNWLHYFGIKMSFSNLDLDFSNVQGPLLGLSIEPCGASSKRVSKRQNKSQLDYWEFW